MKFISDYASIRLPETGKTACFSQQVESVSNIHQNVQKQKVRRDIFLKVQSRTNKGLEIECLLQNFKIELPSVLKKQEALSMEIASVLSKLVIDVDGEGSISTLLNHKEVINVWKQLMPELKKKFVGSGSAAYLSGIDKKIGSHNGLLEDLKEYRVLGCLLTGLYREHSSMETNSGKRIKKIGNLVMNVAVPISERMILNNNDKENVELKLLGDYARTDEIEGRIKRALFKKNVYDNASFVIDSYNGNWSVRKEDGFINNAFLKIKTSCGAQYSKSINYVLTRK